MDTRTVTLLQIDPDPGYLAEKFYKPLRKRIYEIELEIDNLRRQLSLANTNLTHERSTYTKERIQFQLELQTIRDQRAQDTEWHISKMSQLQEDKTLLEEQVAELVPRPKEHQHDPNEPRPVLTFDFDGTIKPQIHSGDGGNYPLVDKNSDPFPGVKKWMDKWKSRGSCIHLATAGLYYGGPNDLEIYDARLAMIKGWYKRYGLPIDLVLPKVPANVYYDDRMIEIPGNPSLSEKPQAPVDWNAIGIQADLEMQKRFIVDSTGIWERKEKRRIGEDIEDWPDSNLFKDQPRGYSGPKLDIDMHRTLSQSSSSLRVAPPRKDAVECITKLYEDGITINISCAGWNPKTHPLVDSIRRLAGIRQWLNQWSVPYDRVSAKDHADLYFDDKGVRFIDWQADMPRIRAKLPKSISYTA